MDNQNNNIKIKTCIKCGFIGEETFFAKGRNVCKKCASIYTKNYRKENKEKIRKDQKEYRINNKEKIKVKRKQTEHENPEKTKANRKKRNKKYREKNPEKVKETQKKSDKKYKENNPEKYNEKSRKGSENFRAKNPGYQNRYQKQRRQNDNCFRIMQNIKIRISKTIKSQGFSKNGECCEDYIPFHENDLVLNIQNKFEPWMNWQNQGAYKPKIWDDNDFAKQKWQIDHWIPLYMLPYTSMKDKNFRIAWSTHNLRPISAKQNILENNRKTIGKIYTAQEYKDLCILIELLKEIIDNPINKPELIVFYESMIKAKEDYEKENDINQIERQDG